MPVIKTVRGFDGTRIPVWYKDSDDVEDYTFNWSLRLAAGDSIVGVSVTVPDGMTLVSPPNFTDIYSTVWLAGGVIGATYTVTFHITTNYGRQHDRSFQLIIGQK